MIHFIEKNMPEQQNIEYKSSWHDNYLDWVCGFANAQGGKIYIGKDDNGSIIGVAGYKDLMEKIPNKIKNLLGITAEVNLLQEVDKHFIEIIVQPYSVPISLRGRYFYRSGSVKQELTGAALNDFLLERIGKRWDSVPVPTVQVEDLKAETFTFFKEKGIKSGRIAEDSRNDTPLQVLENLKLVDKSLLNRAAVMLFHPDPEKFVSGAYIKIGFFRKDIYNKEDLSKLNLNERQIDALVYFKYKGEITSSEYATKYNISDRTARRDLSELADRKLLKNEGDTKVSKYTFP